MTDQWGCGFTARSPFSNGNVGWIKIRRANQPRLDVSGIRTTATASFWDIETSSQIASVVGTGLTTTKMQTTSTFLDAGWGFIDETENGTDDIWWILEGQDYPRLWWELLEEN